MNIQMKSALIGAIIPTVGAFVIFFLGNFFTESKLERDTVQVLSEKFDSVEKSMSYEEALQAIYEENENIKIQLNELTAEISEKQLQVDVQKTQEEIDRIIKTATGYWDDSNFIQSLTLLKNSKSIMPEIESLYKQYSDEYCLKLLGQADTLISDMKYEEAIELINNSLTIVYDDSVLMRKVNDIQNSKPQNFINSIKPYEKYGYTEKIGGDFMQMGGDKYYNGFQLGEAYETSYAIFNLNAKYSKITCTIGHVDGSGEADKTLIIFGDDKIIETIDIGFQDLPKEFSINVEEVKQLKFERTDGYTKTGIANIIIQ